MEKENLFKKIKEKLNTILTVVIFLILIALFTVAGLLKKDRVFSPSENRYLAQKPEFSADSFFKGDFATDYEEYITDQFIGRDRWIAVKTMTELALGKKDINGVYIGKDDYLIEMQNDIDEVKAYANADRMVAFLNKETEILGKEHVSMMIVPTAVAVLTQKLPAHAESFDQNSYIEYMNDAMQGTFVDVRTVLREHVDEDIYYRTDHHWTTWGAFLAYQKWAEMLQVTPYEREDFKVSLAADDFLGTIYSKVNVAKRADELYLYEIKDDIRYEIDFDMGAKKMDSLYAPEHLSTKDKYSVFLDGNHSVVDIKTVGGHTDGDTLLIIKDSYAHCFVPFVANHYARTVVIDLRYLKMPISQVLETYQVTDILVLYNVAHFAADTNFSLLEY